MQNKVSNMYRVLLNTVSIIIIISVSCRKTTLVDNEIKSGAARESFYRGSENLDPTLTKLVNSIKKNAVLNSRMAEFIEKNGTPVWDQVIYTTGVKSKTNSSENAKVRSMSTFSVTQGDDSKGIFFIPLKSQNNEIIQSYITAYKHNDSSYEYRLYNRDSLDRIRPTSDSAKNHLANTEAIFATFEKKINNRDIIHMSGMSIRNADISFNTSQPNKATNKVQPNSVSCLLVVTITMYYELQYDSYTPPHWVAVGMTIDIELTCWGANEVQEMQPDYTGNGGGNTNNWWLYGTGWPWNNPYMNEYDIPWGFFYSSANNNLNENIDYSLLDNFDEDEILSPTVDDDQTPLTFNSATDTWPDIASVFPVAQFKGYDGRNCMAICKTQISLKNLTDLGYSSLTVFQAFERGNLHPTAAKNGVDYMVSKLKKGEPVIVGVDWYNSGYNAGTDATTDHFVTVVGCGTDSKGNYFLFFDNATARASAGASPYNRLYYNTNTGDISGHTSATEYTSGASYRVTQIRKNK